MPSILRITTQIISLRLLLTGQMRYMQENGINIAMASADGPEREVVMKAERSVHHIIPFTRAVTPIQDLRCLIQLIRLIRSERPDIVHTHTPKAGLLGMMAARICNVPIRIHTIAGLPFMTAKGIGRSILKAMEKLTYWNAQHVWPNSKSIFAFVKENELCPAHKMSIVGEGSSNGIDLDEYSASKISLGRIKAAKSQVNFEESATYFLAVGRMVKDKGIPELVNVFQQLYKEEKKLRLVLVGPLEKERKGEFLHADILETISQHPGIIHINWTDDVAAFLSIADVLVHASHREGFPNVLLQAGVMECPIVCSDIPGNIDIVEDGVTGFRFPVGKENALEDVLKKALRESEKTQKMAVNLQQRIKKNFDRKVIHQELLTRYKLLLSEREI